MHALLHVERFACTYLCIDWRTTNLKVKILKSQCLIISIPLPVNINMFVKSELTSVYAFILSSTYAYIFITDQLDNQLVFQLIFSHMVQKFLIM